MKMCEYCGRENQDEAAVCHECGTSEFVATIPLTPTDVASESVEREADAPVELQRCRDPESVAQIARILDAAGIAYKRLSPSPMFDISKIGVGEDV